MLEIFLSTASGIKMISNVELSQTNYFLTNKVSKVNFLVE